MNGLRKCLACALALGFAGAALARSGGSAEVDTAQGTAAGCVAIDGNLVANCGFEAGDPPTGWSGFGALSRDASTVLTGAYSLRAGSAVFGNDIPTVFVNSSCFAVVAGRPYVFGAAVRLVASTANVDCAAIIVSFAQQSCVGGIAADVIGAGVSFGAPTDWLALQGAGAVSSGRVSAYVQLFCDGGDPGDAFTVNFDDAFLTAAADSIFANGFEP